MGPYSYSRQQLWLHHLNTGLVFKWLILTIFIMTLLKSSIQMIPDFVCPVFGTPLYQGNLVATSVSFYLIYFAIVVSSLWLMASSKQGALISGHAFFPVCNCATEIRGSYDWPVDSLTCLNNCWWALGQAKKTYLNKFTRRIIVLLISLRQQTTLCFKLLFFLCASSYWMCGLLNMMSMPLRLWPEPGWFDLTTDGWEIVQSNSRVRKCKLHHDFR